MVTIVFITLSHKVNSVKTFMLITISVSASLKENPINKTTKTNQKNSQT